MTAGNYVWKIQHSEPHSTTVDNGDGTVTTWGSDDGRGNDTFIYRQTRPLAPGQYREIVSDLGLGNDTFLGYTAEQGRYAGTKFIVDGYTGDDALHVTVQGALRTGSEVGMGLQGGLNWDSVFLDASTYRPRTEAGATLWANLSANTYGAINDVRDSGNNVGFSYAGEMDGRLLFNLMGSGGDDWLGVDLRFTYGTTGTVGDGLSTGARLSAGYGSDAVAFRLYNESGSYPYFRNRVVLDGGGLRLPFIGDVFGRDEARLNAAAYAVAQLENIERPITWVA